MTEMQYIALALVLWNIVTFTLYGVDKRKAQKNKWRISETTLIACAFLMSAVGALLGMSVFRHKTKHLKFKLLFSRMSWLIRYSQMFHANPLQSYLA